MSEAHDAWLNSALAQLRQVYERVCAFGDLANLLKNPPRGAVKEALDDDLSKLIGLARHLRDAGVDRVASESLPVARVNPDLWRFYERDFLPKQESFRALYLDSFWAALDLPEGPRKFPAAEVLNAWALGETPERQIEEAFRIGITLVGDRVEDYGGWCGLDEEDVRRAERIQSAAFFTPEEWNRNMQELRPVVTAHAPSRHPIHVRVRLVEIGRSFIFGNWLSTLALCRSLLGYSLIDCSGKWRVEAYETVYGKRRSRRLADLIDEYRPHTPEFIDRMETIKNLGNHVMHPSKHYYVVRFPAIMRRDALQSIDAIRDVLEKLYG